MSEKNITIEPGSVYVVTDSDRSFDTVTIKNGGRLDIQTSALVTINNLVKQQTSED